MGKTLAGILIILIGISFLSTGGLGLIGGLLGGILGIIGAVFGVIGGIIGVVFGVGVAFLAAAMPLVVIGLIVGGVFFLVKLI